VLLLAVFEGFIDLGKESGGFDVFTGAGGDTCQSLDRVAHFVRATIPRPDGARDVIKDIMDNYGYIWSLGSPENAAEIKELFLRDNQYFTSK